MDNAFEIQHLCQKEHHGKGYGKEMFTFALKEAQNVIWLGLAGCL